MQIDAIKHKEKMKNGIVFYDIGKNKKDIFERDIKSLEHTWPFVTAWIDSVEEVSNFLLVFLSAQVNELDRQIDQTLDEYLPRLKGSVLAKHCEEIIPFAEYNSRRNNLPSAVDVPIPLSNTFEGLTIETQAPPRRKKSGNERSQTQMENEKQTNAVKTGTEEEWTRVEVIFYKYLVGFELMNKCPNSTSFLTF